MNEEQAEHADLVDEEDGRNADREPEQLAAMRQQLEAAYREMVDSAHYWKR